MALSITFRGTTYTIPQAGNVGWGAALTTYLQAIGASFADTILTATGTSARAPFFITPSAEPTGPNVVGQLYMTTAGVLKVCTSAGTPGTWVSVGGQT